jgi:hypothetical protein
MQTEFAYLSHYAVGAVAILLWWGAFLNRKGSPAHKRFGRLFLGALGATLVTVGLIFFGSSRDFAPPEVIQFTYLCICVVTVGGTALAAIRLQRDVERFRGTWFRILGAASFLLGGVVLAAGLATGDPMPVIFSVIGLLYGGAMLRFAWFGGALHPNWWLGWHLNGMCFLFNAVHGTFLAVTWRLAVDPAADVNAVTQIATMAIALIMRVYFGRRFNAPLGFGLPQPVSIPSRPA